MSCNFHCSENYNSLKIFNIIPVIMMLIFSGCSESTVKDDKLYNVKQQISQNEINKIDSQLETKGNEPFYKITFNQSINKIPISQSPDKKYIFFMSPSIDDYNNDVIVGSVTNRFNLNRYDTVTKESIIIKSDIPLISTVKWNKDDDIVAFCGGNMLTIYSLTKGKLLFEDDVKHDLVTYFGWSPDGKRLYTEHPNLVNSSIYYIDSNDKVEGYNTNEIKYYKGTLDDKLYYVTITDNQKDILNQTYTAVTDNNGNIVKTIHDGKIRDYCGTSLILLGETGFGLYYIKDINDCENCLFIDKNYIYDAKFIYNGNFAYIIKNEDVTKNDFILKIINKDGKILRQIEVSGSSFSLMPDGEKAKISGPSEEIIDFKNNSITSISNGDAAKEDDKIHVYETLRHGYDIIGKFLASGKINIDDVKKYFVNTKNPNQYAYFDIISMYKDNKDNINQFNMNYSDQYQIDLHSLYYNEYFNNGYKRVEVLVSGYVENSKGTGIGIQNQIELIYFSKDNKWYITGLSTFTETPQYIKVKSLCQEYIKQAKQGKLFNSELKDKDISLGQIQFWQMSEPHMADKIQNSNYCKVYLKIKDNKDNEIVYKMILLKDKDTWKPEMLSKENLSQLF